MKHVFLVLQNETDNDTYSDDTVISSFDTEEVADTVAAHLQQEVGYVTRFNEQRTFSVKQVLANQEDNPQDIESILDDIHDKFDW